MKNEALLHAIIATPDDDTPRLAYAGWLEHHGDVERAEFIRLQCAIATLAADDPRQSALHRREHELLDQYGWTWAEEFGTDINEWVFRRGFIECVDMPLETSAADILAVLRKAPIRHIRDTSQFVDLTGVIEALPSLERLTGLEFWGLYAVDDRLVAQLLASPYLRNLRTLILHHDRNGNLVKEYVLVEGLASPFRANVQELAVNVDGCWRGPSMRIVQAMARSPHLGHLRKLNLSHARLGVRTVQALGQSPALANLRELDLGGCSFPAQVWDAVLRLPQLARLKWLRLHWARVVDRDGHHVAELSELPEYRRIFEQRVETVDWETDFISPWDGETCWRGLRWEDRRRRPLFAMHGYVQSQDYSSLVADYRRLCLQLADRQITAAIDALPFDRYEAALHPGFRAAVDSLGRNKGQAIYYSDCLHLMG